MSGAASRCRPSIGLGTLVDGAVHPGWTWAFVRAEPIRVRQRGDLARRRTDRGDGRDPVTLAEYVNSQFDPSLSWDDVEWFRSMWDGPLILKGIQSVADAGLAAEHGVEAIALSNHGGRQLDVARRRRSSSSRPSSTPSATASR